MASEEDLRLEVENVDLSRLLAQAEIRAAEQKVKMADSGAVCDPDHNHGESVAPLH